MFFTFYNYISLISVVIEVSLLAAFPNHYNLEKKEENLLVDPLPKNYIPSMLSNETES